jgi:hypothetical protein
MLKEIKLFFKGFFEKRVTMLFLGAGVTVIITAFNDQWMTIVSELFNKYLNTSIKINDSKDIGLIVTQIFVGVFFIIMGIIFYIKYVRKVLVIKRLELVDLMSNYKKEMLERFNRLCYPNIIEELNHLEPLANDYSEIFNGNKKLFRYYQKNIVSVFKKIDNNSQTIQRYKQKLEDYKTPFAHKNNIIDEKYFSLTGKIDELIREQESYRKVINAFNEYINKLIKKL